MSKIEPGFLQNAEIPHIVDQEQFTIELQKYYSGHNEKSKKLEWTNERIQSVLQLLEDFNTAKSRGKRATNKQYHHANKYDIMNVGNQKVLIMKRKNISDPVLQIIPSEEYYKTILDAHIATGHGRRDKIVHAFRDKYVVPIFAITIFINLCKTCLSKKTFPKSGNVVKPLMSDDFNRRGQIDLVDFQTSPDEEYKWLLQYQDHLTKFSFLRPLKSNRVKEVATEIIKIFLEVGCPSILRSDNGHEFTASVIKEIVHLWPACKIVYGGPRYPQSQGSIEHFTQDVKNMIRAWMVDNKSTSWSIGCYFVQFQKNSSYHSTIARTPYKALFGVDPKLGLSSTNLSKDIISKLETEEDVERVFEEIVNNEKQYSEKDPTAKEQKKVTTIKRTKINTKTNDYEEVPIVNHEKNVLDQNNILSNPEIHPNVHEKPVIIGDIIVQKSEIKHEKISEVSEEILIPDQVNPDLLPKIHEIPITNATLNILNSEINMIKQEQNVDQEIVTSHLTDKDIISNGSNILPNINDITIKVEEILMCYICNKEASEAHTCMNCKKIVHTICGVVSEDDEGYFSQLLCNLCVNKRNIVQGREQSHINLKRVADDAIAISSKKFKDISITSSSILVEIPKVDRGLVLLSPQVSLPNDIPVVTLPLRTIAPMSSSFGEQEMTQCNCKKINKGQCISNKCNCKKANILCNYRCHSFLTCNNK